MAAASDHRKSDGELGDSVGRLEQQIPGQRTPGQRTRRFKNAHRYAEHSEEERDEEQPERPTPSPDDAHAKLSDERRG